MMRKPIGSQWMLNPNLAGYGNVWQPGVVTIHHYVMPEDEQPPTKNGVTPPRRQYVVTMPGGLFLFANDECLSDKDGPPVPTPVPEKRDPKDMTKEELDIAIREQTIKLGRSLGFEMKEVENV